MNEKNKNTISDTVKVKCKKCMSNEDNTEDQMQLDSNISDSNLNISQDEEANGISIEILGTGNIR